MNRVALLAVFVLAAAALFFLLSSSGAPKPEIVTGDQQNPPGTQQDPGIRQGPKILRLAVDTDPKTLDPISITDTISDGLARKLFNGLVRLKKQGDAYIPVGDLAESYELSADGKVYTFKLRKGVKFHNGREVKAADFVYSIGRLLGPGSTRADWIKPFVKGSEARFKDPAAPLGITAADDYTLTIELEAPFAPFIQHLCTVNLSVVPQECAEDKTKPFARNPVGTGPFTLKEWKIKRSLRRLLQRAAEAGRARVPDRKGAAHAPAQVPGRRNSRVRHSQRQGEGSDGQGWRGKYARIHHLAHQLHRLRHAQWRIQRPR